MCVQDPFFFFLYVLMGFFICQNLSNSYNLIYRSCLNVSADHEKVNLANLLEIIEEAGGWHLTGNSSYQWKGKVTTFSISN